MKKNQQADKQESKKEDNKDVEYSEELADIEDREAINRAKAATQRVNKENI
ncbi:hypothetical protein CR194_16380 [Salipaludibacillus keqinensis]|jgi:hypothetical protein|uniref:YfhD family protein n=1 Tax=Salipaludibacillus keqinensis TaxID=2045207 RepID=A0A323TDU5_9BACI|nr:YfhD family protein [Salipaludibacillus keqinensis]PYZ92404.1 hypothetical protein CR194_16380 [Salipaludibacillus keqinensis]